MAAAQPARTGGLSGDFDTGPAQRGADRGRGEGTRRVIDAAGVDRASASTRGASLTLQDLTVRGGHAAAGRNGGAVLNQGSLVAVRVSFVGNSAGAATGAPRAPSRGAAAPIWSGGPARAHRPDLRERLPWQRGGGGRDTAPLRVRTGRRAAAPVGRRRARSDRVGRSPAVSATTSPATGRARRRRGERGGPRASPRAPAATAGAIAVVGSGDARVWPTAPSPATRPAGNAERAPFAPESARRPGRSGGGRVRREPAHHIVRPSRATRSARRSQSRQPSSGRGRRR